MPLLSDVVDSGQITDIVAVQHDLAGELFHLLFNFIVFDHDHDEINVRKELVQIVILICNNILRDERIVDLEFGREVTA